MYGPDPNWTPTLKTIAGRRSVRAFIDRDVPLEVIGSLIEAAARAPSGNNSQPWKLHVLTGASKSRLTDAIMATRTDDTPEPAMEYHYYPESWPEPYLGRRRQVGWALYNLLGIQKGDRAGSRAWHDRNFDFFGAPVGLIVTTDRRLGLGALIDVGMFLEGLAIGARSFGVETCPQAAFAAYHEVVRSLLALPTEDMVVCGMALGFEDRDAVQNALRTPRAALADFTTFHN
jgi:nitroreductase